MLLPDKKDEFDHFLITRFNLKKAEWNFDKNSKQVLDESWLINRIELFNNYCLPSVVGQTTKNFKWLIFFQTNPGPDILKLLEKLKNYSFIEPILVDGYERFQRNLADYIIIRCHKSCTRVLTSRLDNDDALNKNFIKHLQEQVGGSDPNTIFEFPRGLVLDLGENRRLGSLNYPLNQFVSLLENKSGNINTVLSQEHDKWDHNYIITSINLKEAWLQISHSQNMVNRFNGELVYSNKLNHFKIAPVRFPLSYNFRIFYLLSSRKIRKYINRISSFRFS